MLGGFDVAGIGGGAAGFAAAERLRREQYQGSLVMLSDDDALPVQTQTLSRGEPEATSNTESQSIGMSVPWSPPEMFEDDPKPDVRSDVFSLAATIYTILAGHTPFEVPGRSNGTLDLIGRIERGAITAIERADLPASLVPVLHKGMARGQAMERAIEMLRLVNIPEPARRASEYPHQLSGGMRQRVMIAMALALEPQVLIMDEPTTALDVVMQRQIVEQIAELRERLGFSVIFITHDVSLLIEIADRIAIMYAGEIVESAPAQALRESPHHPYTRGLMASFPPLTGPKTRLVGIPGSPPDLNDMPTGCRFHPRCPLCVPEEPLYEKQVNERPRLRELGPQHLVACHLAGGES